MNAPAIAQAVALYAPAGAVRCEAPGRRPKVPCGVLTLLLFSEGGSQSVALCPWHAARMADFVGGLDPTGQRFPTWYRAALFVVTPPPEPEPVRGLHVAPKRVAP